MTDEQVERLIHMYLRLAVKEDQLRTAMGSNGEGFKDQFGYLLDGFETLLLDLLGVPPDTWNDETQGGYCRDWWGDLLYKDNADPETVREVLDAIRSALNDSRSMRTTLD